MTNRSSVYPAIKVIRYVLSAWLMGAVSYAYAQPPKQVTQFLAGLDSIRNQLKIPGMSAAIKEGNHVLFVQGFGYADLEK